MTEEMINSPDFGIELEFAIELAKEAGRITRQYFGLTTEVQWKKDNTPLTEADKAINQMVIDRVLKTFPEDGILGEEDSHNVGSSRLWVVDPIDGTQPFSVGVPTSTFSIALVEEGEPRLGVVYDPFQDRMYQGVKGQGAFLNGSLLKVSDATTLKQSYIVLSSRMGGDFATTGQVFDHIERAGGKTFSFRSMVYGFMLVAVGKAVASFAGNFGPWDLAAAKVILEEAGARVTDLDGQPLKYDKTDRGVLVSNGLLHQELLTFVA